MSVPSGLTMSVFNAHSWQVGAWQACGRSGGHGRAKASNQHRTRGSSAPTSTKPVHASAAAAAWQLPALTEASPRPGANACHASPAVASNRPAAGPHTVPGALDIQNGHRL